MTTAGVLVVVVAAVAAAFYSSVAAWSIRARLRGARIPALTEVELRPASVGTREVALLAVTVIAALAAGAAVAFVSVRVAVGAMLILTAALVFSFIRSVSSRLALRLEPLSRPHVGRDMQSEESLPTHPWSFRFAKPAYYLGLVFLALLTIRVGGQVTVSDLLFLLSLVLASATLVIARRPVPVRLPRLLLIGIGIFAVGALLSTFQSEMPLQSAAVIVRLVFLTVFWFWLGTIVLSRHEDTRTALTLWVISAAICGGGAILQVMAGDVIPNTDTVYGRSTGFTGHPNDLGGLTAIAFVPALMLAARRGVAGHQRAMYLAILLSVTAGLILSGSVGAFLAAAAAVFVWFSLQRDSRPSILILGALGIAALVMTGVQAARGSPTPLERFYVVTGAPDESGRGAGSLESRIETYRVALEEIRRNPFVGVGLDLVSITKPFGVVSHEHDVHNLIIGTWYKAGLLGLVGFLVALGAVFRTGWLAIFRSQTEEERLTAAALISACVAFVVFSMSEPVLYSRIGWIPAALLVAIAALQAANARPPATRAMRASDTHVSHRPTAAGEMATRA